MNRTPRAPQFKLHWTWGLKLQRVAPLEMIYWGPHFSHEDVQDALDKLLPSAGFAVTLHDDIDRFVGKKISEGLIVGRMVGRMEWGARAFGKSFNRG